MDAGQIWDIQGHSSLIGAQARAGMSYSSPIGINERGRTDLINNMNLTNGRRTRSNDTAKNDEHLTADT